MIQKTLILVKPDGVERNLIGQIISYYEKAGLKVIALEGPLQADPILVRKHYKIDDYNYVLTLGHVDMSGKSEQEKESEYNRKLKIVQSTIEYFLSGSVVKLILEGEEAISRAREVTGKTDPGKSSKGSIRGDLGIDSFEFSDKEQRSVYNLVHASGTTQEAKEEIDLWFGKNNFI